MTSVFSEEILKKEDVRNILKQTQDLFFLCHEYNHGINKVLLKEYRPDIIEAMEAKRKEFESADEEKRKKLQEEERNSVLPRLGESLPISIERIIAERVLEDEDVSNEEKNSVNKFWELHKRSLVTRKLENDPMSKYSEFDEAMIYYKVYRESGEEMITDLIKKLDLQKLSQIKKYSDPDRRLLSDEYKRILDMDGTEFIEEFTLKD